MAIETVLGKVVEAYGVDGQNQMTGAPVLTGLRAIVKMDLPGTKEGRDLKYDVMMMVRRMRDYVDEYNDQVKDEYLKVTKPVMEKKEKPEDPDKPMMRPNQQGVPQEIIRVSREDGMKIDKEMGEMLKTKKVTLPDREMIVWPVMLDSKDPEKDPAKQRRILPGTDDMILTVDFINYEKACKE